MRRNLAPMLFAALLLPAPNSQVNAQQQPTPNAASIMQATLSVLVPSGSSTFIPFGTFRGTVAAGGQVSTTSAMTWLYNCPDIKSCRLLFTNSGSGSNASVVYLPRVVAHVIDGKKVGHNRTTEFLPILPDPAMLLLQDSLHPDSITLQDSDLIVNGEQTIDLHVVERAAGSAAPLFHDWYIGVISHLPWRLTFEQPLIRTGGPRRAEPDITQLLTVDYESFAMTGGSVCPTKMVLTSEGTPVAITLSADKSTPVTDAQFSLQENGND